MRGATPAWLLLAALLATALAGCGSPVPPITTPTAADDRMRVAGLVESDTLVPLANATVAIAELNLTARTDDLGRFAFPPMPPRVYTVEARLEGYRGATLVARPETNSGSLDFVLQRILPPAPRQDQFHFRGSFDCAYATPAGGGACDGGAGVLGAQAAFSFPLAPGWRTAVVDVLFDPDASPGLDGLALRVRGQAPDGAQRDHGSFNGSRPFTARLDPGLAPQDGAAPVDANLTRILLDVSPQGRLGTGAGANLQFDLYATVFYVAPAPPGFTLRMDP